MTWRFCFAIQIKFSSLEGQKSKNHEFSKQAAQNMKPLLLCCPLEFFQVWYHFWNRQTISDNFCFGAISKILTKFFRKFCLNWTCDPEILNPARMSHNSESIGRTENYDHSFPLEFWWLEDFVLRFKSNSQVWRVKSPKTMKFQSRLHITRNHLL